MLSFFFNCLLNGRGCFLMSLFMGPEEIGGEFLKLYRCLCEFPHYSLGAYWSGLQLTPAL